MIPFEALMPYAVIVTMIGVASGGMALGNTWRHEGKKMRVHRDHWDKMMMERDMRLTGKFRAQSIDPIAPPEFATSSTWKATKPWDR
ncbi:hypothetical protein BZA70DRAFT_287421 [Myxozyma melibiosi]|uniref:NADH dehydrogenase [ubiquinone] 1 alpha subcomplex subunit 1 n=1 Tax=Myxozyma melibiosi TaxID=54550 RepID=A0ABR1FEA7_9ASCO